MLDEGQALRDMLRLALVAVGRGGQGDVGQRIRDEILHVQAQNNVKVHAADFIHRMFWKLQAASCHSVLRLLLQLWSMQCIYFVQIMHRQMAEFSLQNHQR